MTTSLYQQDPQKGTVSSTNLTSLYSNTANFTTGQVNSAVYSVNGGLGVVVNPTTGNVVVNIGQAVAPTDNVQFANVTATGNLSNNYFTLANSAGTTGQVLTTNGAGATAWTSVSGLGLVNSVSGAGAGINVSPTTGAVVVSNTGVTSITGTANQVIASASTGAVTLSTPQDIATTSTPTFAGANLGNVTVGVTTDNTITTTTGDLTIDSATNLVGITANLKVNNGTLYVDATNNRVGINNLAPAYELDVSGTGRFTQNIIVEGGNINTTATTANIFTNTATTINIGGAGTSTLTDVINIGTNGQTYATQFGGLISQNGFTTQASSRFINQTTISPILIMTTTRKSMKSLVTITDDVTGAIHSVEILAIKKTSTGSAWLTTYAEIYSDAPLATFTVADTGPSLALYATLASTNSTDISIMRNSLGE